MQTHRLFANQLRTFSPFNQPPPIVRPPQGKLAPFQPQIVNPLPGQRGGRIASFANARETGPGKVASFQQGLGGVGAVGARSTFLTLSTLSAAVSFWHGLNRNDSLAWGLGWGLLGAMFPVVTPLYAVYQGYATPEQPDMPMRNPRLSYKERKKLKSSDFALPKQRKYPIYDRAHAANALSRATQQVRAGNLSRKDAARIRKKVCERYDFPSCP